MTVKDPKTNLYGILNWEIFITDLTDVISDSLSTNNVQGILSGVVVSFS